MELNINDYINDEQITRMSDTFIFFKDGKRKGKNATIRNIKNGSLRFKYNQSPNVDFDWSNKEEVLEYYNSFNEWTVVLRMGDTYTNDTVDIVDNLVYIEGCIIYHHLIQYLMIHVKSTNQ